MKGLTDRQKDVLDYMAARQGPVEQLAPEPAGNIQTARIHPEEGKTRLEFFSFPNTCKADEEATFYVKALNDDKPVNSGSLTVNFTNSNGNVFDKRIISFANGNPVKLSTKLNEPGIIIAKTSDLCDAHGNRLNAAYPQAAVAVETDRIRPVEPAPDDFMSFWRRHLERVKGSAVTVGPMPGKNYKNHNAFLLTANMPDNEKFYAVMLMPKASGKHLVSMSIPGAGPSTAIMWPEEYEKDDIIIGIHVHKYPPTTDSEEMVKALAEYENELGMQYCLENMYDRDKYFYRRVICGLNVIVDYVAGLKEFDGKNFQLTGTSQGAALGIALAALNKNITAVALNVPSMCDHQGWKIGRAPGWPGFHWHGADATAPYYDSCNFAPYVTAPVFMAIGHIDNITPPAGGYAAFNQIKGPKELLPMYLRGHEIPPEFHKQKEEFLKKHAR